MYRSLKEEGRYPDVEKKRGRESFSGAAGHRRFRTKASFYDLTIKRGRVIYKLVKLDGGAGRRSNGKCRVRCVRRGLLQQPRRPQVSRKARFIMKNANRVNVVLLIGCMLFLTMVGGCGGAHIVTINADVDIANYNTVYVEEADVASAKQNEKIDEANARYAQYAREQIIAALRQKGRLEILNDISTTPDSLTLQTTLRIVYGSRALRYMVGYGAGSGSISITMKLVDSTSDELKKEVHSNSTLAIGLFGGDMDGVIEKNIKRVVDEFIKQLE